MKQKQTSCVEEGESCLILSWRHSEDEPTHRNPEHNQQEVHKTKYLYMKDSYKL